MAGNGTVKTKSKSDYAKLLDDAELRRDGLDLRRERSERELRRLLGEQRNAEQIMQVITRQNDGYGATVGKLAVADENVSRYKRLLASSEATVAVVEKVPTTPA